jgi:hypothetical protein
MRLSVTAIYRGSMGFHITCLLVGISPPLLVAAATRTSETVDNRSCGLREFESQLEVEVVEAPASHCYQHPSQPLVQIQPWIPAENPNLVFQALEGPLSCSFDVYAAQQCLSF